MTDKPLEVLNGPPFQPAAPGLLNAQAAPGLLNAQDIFKAKDIRTVDLFIPEWDGMVRVRAITSQQLAELNKRMEQRKGNSKETNTTLFREWMVVYSLVNEQGNPVFGSEHVQALRAKSAGAMQKICDAAMALAGLGDKDIEDMVGNSNGTASAS